MSKRLSTGKIGYYTSKAVLRLKKRNSMLNFLKKIPETPGIYIFKNAKNEVLYIGKAANLKRRVTSYFSRSHDSRIEKLISEIKKAEFRKTDSAIEALILESQLIKKYDPIYNIREKDDKSFLYVEITKEKFPRVLLVRGKELNPITSSSLYGPFISASSIREALRILRKIFPWSFHLPENVGKAKRPCLDYQIGLCPGVCVNVISQNDYLKNIRCLKIFFQGKKKKLIKKLESEMKKASKTLEFEQAAKLRKQIFALKHIQDIALLNTPEISNSKFKIPNPVKRIEGYDVSNISGASAVGVMVVFKDNKPDKNEYRKFKIQSIQTPDDIGMLREVLDRRLNHSEWLLPDLILVDGGRGQVNAIEKILMEHGLKIPTIGIAKGRERKRNDFIGKIPNWTEEKTLINIRNEAHRFSKNYHSYLRSRNFLKNRK